MNHRYKIRAFASGDGDGETAAGTIVRAVDRSFAVYAPNADEAEKAVQQEVAANKLPKGRVYVICPLLGNPEPIRAFAVCAKGTAQKVYLDPAKGMYSEFRRIRYADLRKTPREEGAAKMQEAS